MISVEDWKETTASELIGEEVLLVCAPRAPLCIQ